MTSKRTHITAVPSIHLNGTSRESLFSQSRTACDAIRAAIDALQQAAPHGRDYYVQGRDAFTAARKEHVDRLVRLQSVYDEMMAMALAIAEVE